ncbi:uncharacterized protein LOC104883970 [Beta vulgaris subsp. vulgaris]|uniref:uncharacterized protein LOC104883970 n=1 Tax=Beta vulgaris subsp. vulgaris TaxID=3555 RepID=UPI00203677D3|nr:uncharacterized protein LOC104883970 [Beta vulgaris subsp. vulgaris]XP_048490768.1 uncharacterized protein LOC104883970 [Beta vulgaris subsp. vulgaris]
MGKQGKRTENSVSRTSSSGFHTSLSLREEASGKKQFHSAKSIFKHKHFQNLAQWAAGVSQGEDDDEPSACCLGAFFGRRFAEFGESLGISPDPSLFPCQRCETILEPGVNCTIRIEKNRAKSRRHSRSKSPTQNNVVYKCHFCLHRNLKRGTPKGYMKDLFPSRASSSKSKLVTSAAKKCPTTAKTNISDVKSDVANEASSPAISNVCSTLTDSPNSSLANSGAKLLDGKRRKRKKTGLKGSADETVASSAPAEMEKASGTGKRRRKSWTTLKDIADNEEHNRNQRFANFSIPFVL